MEKFKKVKDCDLINFSKIENGNSHFFSIKGMLDIPFEIKRVFYLYDVPANKDRGAHAHVECHQILIAVNGSFDVTLDDGESERNIQLNKSDVGLHILPGIWATESNFSEGAICLVINSHLYSEIDYLRDYSVFKKFRAELNNRELF